MTKPRVAETNEGIQDALDVEVFNRFAQGMRDKGWNNVDAILSSGVQEGCVLEIGPGPGYVGLEWLKACPEGKLTALEISPEMIRLAQRNALEYGLNARVEYVEGNALSMPFADAAFDAVFSNGSLHEWEDPARVFTEIARVLRPLGRFCVTDMRRNVNPVLARLICASTKPKQIRPGFWTSLNASYTKTEIQEILRATPLQKAEVREEFFGLCIWGMKRD
jgi:ubiquinone/menaquinone biosynthesis C-methylase UbiE